MSIEWRNLPDGVKRFTNDESVEGWVGGGPSSAHMVPDIELFSNQDAEEYVGEEYIGGWYHRLTAPGYLDSTEWTGPFNRFFDALRDCCRLYSIDLDGNERE